MIVWGRDASPVAHIDDDVDRLHLTKMKRRLQIAKRESSCRETMEEGVRL